MSEVGQSVFQAVKYLRGFFGDVSKMLTVVEDAVAREGLASPWGSGSIWRLSYSYTLPSRWVPSFVARQYVESGAGGAKPDRLAAWYAFFVVHFTPERLGEPVAVWGVATLESRQDIWGSFNRLLLAEQGPRFLDRLRVDEWQSVLEPVLGLRTMHYRACAVTDLCDENTVGELVLQPLLAEIARARQEVRDA